MRAQRLPPLVLACGGAHVDPKGRVLAVFAEWQVWRAATACLLNYLHPPSHLWVVVVRLYLGKY